MLYELARPLLFALDPVLFFRGDPDAYRAWFSMLRTPPERPSEPLQQIFHADYVLCDVRPQWGAFRAALEADPQIQGPLNLAGNVLYKVAAAEK